MMHQVSIRKNGSTTHTNPKTFTKIAAALFSGNQSPERAREKCFQEVMPIMNLWLVVYLPL
jgi:hypothetical protein